MKDIPYLRKRNNPNIPERAKNKDRSPSIANKFEVMAMNESCVIASTAGMESTANIKSVDSTKTSVMKAMVA